MNKVLFPDFPGHPPTPRGVYKSSRDKIRAQGSPKTLKIFCRLRRQFTCFLAIRQEHTFFFACGAIDSLYYPINIFSRQLLPSWHRAPDYVRKVPTERSLLIMNPCPEDVWKVEDTMPPDFYIRWYGARLSMTHWSMTMSHRETYLRNVWKS